MLNSTLFFSASSHTSPPIANLTIPPFFSIIPYAFCNHQQQYLLKQPKKRRQSLALFAASYEVGGGYPDDFVDVRDKGSRNGGKGNQKLDNSQYEALLEGGEQVTSVLQEMITILEDMNMDEASEEVAVELAAQGVIGKRVDQMESGFMMALDYMIQLAEKDQDDKRKSLLEVIKETVLSHLTKKCPPHVQVIGLLCRTPKRESRHELLRRVAGGGGVFKSENGTKVHIPGANLNDIANQADDLLETMETRPVVPDRKLLARLVLIREEARNMMGGGILDERNDRGLNTLPEAEVNFLTKLVALKPGKTVQEMIKNVMQGKDEGADNSDSDEEHSTGGKASSGIAGRKSVTGRKPLPVRPGMFLETVSKVLGGIYSGNDSGITAQHLEWVHQKTLQVLQEIAF
ncbi:protein PEP-RELATED DEVELOPMENT ARRESTED 1, chloroplastic [Juglans microcarpa x Juglans regia]|uniref:protein PEP-RELATED DEVELOPMENT ARRESTED 1, chloroplastic n=1 Tax=Juglans microcarpa x Juglans regia TaxID=2249226 RepID=UPI001B7E043D|nr:protein PEP-RELATED DEVELOPMENT ARRESTED 1, chloroplastic [Juglans microcarpa x Juglans regia]